MKFFSSLSTAEKGAWQRRLFSAPIILLLAAYASFYVFAVVQACSPFVDVIPSVDCIVQNSNSTYTAYFGFKNIYTNPLYTFTIPAGGTNPNNYINTGGTTTLNSYLPSNFPYNAATGGVLHKQVAVIYDGTPITWYLGNFTAVVDANTPLCGPTTTTMTTTPNPLTLGQSVFISAQVTAPTDLPAATSGTTVTPAPIVSGTVTFTTGATVLGSGPVQSDGSVSISTANLAGGPNGSDASYPIIASYSGNYAASTSSIVTQVVQQVSPVLECVNRNSDGSYKAHFGYNNRTNHAIDIAAGPQNSFYTSGYAIPITHFLSGRQYDQFQIDFPSTLMLVWRLANRTATASVNSLGCNGQGSTTITVVPAPNPAYFGQNVTISATIIGYNGGSTLPTGTITFADGTTALGTGAVDGSGNASIQTATLTVGTHPITATYGGDTKYTAATSSSVNQVVTKIPTTTVIVSSTPNSVNGQNVTFTATITPMHVITTKLTGSVTFTDGTTTIGTGTVDSTGHATFATAGLTVASHTITANYGGDGNYVASSGTTPQIVGTVPVVMTGNTNAFIRLVQSSSAYTSIDVSIDGATTYPNLTACSIGNYAPLAPGNHAMTVTDASTGSKQLANLSFNFVAGSYYTLVVVGNPTTNPVVTPTLVIIQDDLGIVSGKAKVRVYHFADNAGPVSVGVNSTLIIPSLAFGTASSYSQQNPGVTSFVITLLNNPANQLNDALNVAANQVYSIFIVCGNQTSNQVMNGLPIALPQTGNAIIIASTTNWWLVVITMSLLPFIGGAIGWGAARVVIARRRNQA